MANFIFEDRTEETPQQALDRKALGAAFQIAHAAFGVSQGDPVLAVHALATALSLAVARTDAPLDEILDYVRSRHAEATVMIDQQAPFLRGRRADA